MLQAFAALSILWPFFEMAGKTQAERRAAKKSLKVKPKQILKHETSDEDSSSSEEAPLEFKLTDKVLTCVICGQRTDEIDVDLEGMPEDKIQKLAWKNTHQVMYIYIYIYIYVDPGDESIIGLCQLFTKYNKPTIY